MISYEKQTSFGWLVVMDTFLAGAGGGVFLAGFMLNLLGKHESISKIGILLGPILAIIGSLFLFAELGSKTRTYRVLSNPSSWIARGALFMTVFILCGLVYSIPSLFHRQWASSCMGQSVGIVAAVFSILVSIYPGFLFGVVRAIPFWNTSILPILFMFLSWYTGVAILMLAAVFTGAPMEVVGSREMGGVLLALVAFSFVIIGGYLEVVRHGGRAHKASIQTLKTPLFIYGAGVFGFVVPFVLLLLSFSADSLLTIGILNGISSALLLLGGVVVRHGVLEAGIYQPLR